MVQGDGFEELGRYMHKSDAVTFCSIFALYMLVRHICMSSVWCWVVLSRRLMTLTVCGDGANRLRVRRVD